MLIEPQPAAYHRQFIVGGLGFGLLLFAVVAAGYLHSLAYPYQFDDFSSIRDNHALDDPTDIEAIWTFHPSRFVLHESLALNIAATGRSTAPLRATNFAIHLLAAFVVGWLARDLALRFGGALATPRNAEVVGLLAGLLFAAHPLATQAVTYLIQRTTSLAALFELGAVAFYVRAREAPHGPWLWAASWLLAGLAALTKEMSVALPGVLLLLEFALRASGRPGRSGWRLLPYGLVPVIVLTTAQMYTGEFGFAPQGLREATEISRWTYLLTQLVVIPKYLWLFFWPHGQNLDHDVALRHAPDVAAALGFLLLVGLSALAFLGRKRWMLAAVGWGLFLIGMAPESSLIPIRDVMNEHRVYFPMAGLIWSSAAGLVWLAARAPRWFLAMPILVVVALTVATHQRNKVWQSEQSLWSNVVNGSPRLPRGFNNLGMALSAQGQLAQAEVAYRQAIGLDSSYVHAMVNLGMLLGRGGRLAEAKPLFESAIRLKPSNAPALNNLGLVYAGLGDTVSAMGAFQRAIRIAPGAAEPRVNLRHLEQARFRSGATAGAIELPRLE